MVKMLLIRRLPGIIYTNRYTIVSLLLLCLTVTYFLFKFNFICLNLQAWQHVKKVCKLHSKGLAVGSLCIPLCVTKDIHSLTCHSFQSTKEAVFSAEWHDVKLVFKLASTDVQSLHWYDNNHIKYPTEKEFLSTIRAIVRNKINITLSHDTAIRLSRLKPSYEEMVVEKRRKEMDNLWLLIQDNEYLLSVIYTDRDVFPQLLGTCGPYFAVEYLEPVKDVTSYLSISDSRQEWGNRLKVAVLIMELLEELENGFREPFHLCDIKLEHFGLMKSGTKMKFIDLNGVYPKSVISRIITENVSCDKDEDCEFYDCRTRCDKKNHRCFSYITNNNLQIVCEKIFLGWRMSNRLLVPGLLMSQHTPSELASLLRQCANPESETGKPRSPPNRTLTKRLYNILYEIEQTVNSNFYV